MTYLRAWLIVGLVMSALLALGGCAIPPRCDGKWQGFENESQCQRLLEREFAKGRS